MSRWLLVPVLAVSACADPPSAPSRPVAPPALSAASPAPSASIPIAPAPPPSSSAPVTAPVDLRVTADEALVLLYPEPGEARAAAGDHCASSSEGGERIACLLDVRYAADPEAARLAVDLYRETGSVAGLEPERVMDGGYRGQIHLVPDLPVGAKRVHLAWVSTALVRARDFVDSVRAQAAEPDSVRFRVTHLRLRFFRSVDKRTPSAYADDFVVGYNTVGSLNRSAGAVTDTLFHELFHANDAAHGEFSVRALDDLHRAIRARCGAKTACLAPYAPTDTQVVGGTYYAFQPGNDVREYGAEIASRFFTETAAVLAKKPLTRPPFRCGPPENAKAFDLVVREMFGGVVLGPVCPESP